MNKLFNNETINQWFQDIDKMMTIASGLSIYDIKSEDLKKIVTCLAKKMPHGFNEVNLSSLDKSFKHSFDYSKPVLIYQDLNFEDLLKKILILVDDVIYPTWFNKSSIIFISILSKDEYAVDKIDSRLVHKDLNKVMNLLSLEQMSKLLNQVNQSFSLSTGTAKPLILFESENKTNKLKAPINRIELEDLNKEQKIAVEHLDGPMRVLAPAGSGKTKTLVNRIVNLVNKGIQTNEILALAFNKKAQLEMEERLRKQFGIKNMNISTFHGFGNNVINQTLGWKFQASQEIKGTRTLLNQAIIDIDHPLVFKRNTDPLDDYMNILSKSKNELFSEKEMIVEIDEDEIDFLPIFEGYILNTAKAKFYNYDDMVYLAIRKLLSDPAIRDTMQKTYKYILVDEFQDLNKAQLLLLQILIAPEKNVFVCGDDDQMIYSFRGAKVENILGFNGNDSITKEQVLEINYRSSSNIVNHSKWLIDYNKTRVPKNIKPFKEDDGSMNLFIGESLKDQAEKIVEWVNKLKKTNSKWSDFAILYRYNEYKDLLFMILSKHKIPVADQGVTILNSRVGRTIMAYLTVLLDKKNSSQDHYSEILKKPNKYLTNDFISTVRSWDDFVDTRRGQSYLKRNSYDNYLEFVEMITKFDLKNTNPVVVMNSIIYTFGFKEHFGNQEKKSNDNDSATDMDVLEIIVGFASVFETIEEFYNFFLESKNPHKYINNHNISNDVVHLSTVHKTKGNEYKNVAYYNMNNAPTKEISQKEYEEERRIAYVAMTRAEKNLLVTTEKLNLSPFIKEMFLNPKFRDMNVRALKEEINKFQNSNDQDLSNDLLDIRKELEYRQKILNSMRQGK